MRFLLLTQYFPPEIGAAQVRLLAVARRLMAHGHEVNVVTAMPNYPMGRTYDRYAGRWFMREQIEGLAITRTAIYANQRQGSFGRLLNYFSFAATSIFGCFASPRPDYVIVESPPLFLSFTGLLVGTVRRRPLIVNVSDLWLESAKELGLVTNRFVLGLAQLLERFIYRRSFRVSVQTQGIRHAVAQVIGESKTMFLPNGVDTDLFRPLKDRPPELLDGEIGFVFAGTFGQVSDLDVILSAADLLRSNKQIVVLLVGDGPNRSRISKQVVEQGLTNVRIVAARPVTDIPIILSACRASIVPIRKRPVFSGVRPAKVLPSLACETPVIYAGIGEAAELIDSHDCGLVVPPEDPAALASAINKLADDEVLAAAMGKRGRQLALAEYTWNRIVERWLLDLTGAEPLSTVASPHL